MDQHDPDWINRLIGRFMELQERWERDAGNFDWSLLQALAREGATAYNEESGPSFHVLALDGMVHTEFHERFLASSLEGGFDPFKLVRAGQGSREIPVIDHADLALASLSNPFSARMRASLMQLARSRFEPLVRDIQEGKPKPSLELYRVAEECAESIPLDILDKIEPELARSHPRAKGEQQVNPVEEYLTTAESIVDTGKLYG